MNNHVVLTPKQDEPTFMAQTLYNLQEGYGSFDNATDAEAWLAKMTNTPCEQKEAA